MTTCTRLFEAEAMRDGRLGERERASFARHAATCADCSREVATLEALGNRLRADSGTEAPTNDLHIRRERTRLLAAFDRVLLGDEAPHHGRRLPRVALAALAASAGLAAVLFARWPVHTAPPAEHPEANALIQASGTAVWSKRTEGAREQILLERGALTIRVTHASGAGPILVLLPDGELEDTGTTFTVSAEDGRTTRVSVAEGSVVLRLRGRPPVTLAAGDTWTARPVEPPPAASNPDEQLATTAPTRAPLAAAPSEMLPDPAADFRAAMAAFNDGDSARAATAFTSFVAKHPRDPRAEDAAYLRVIALQRSGDLDGMKAAALEYVQRYPNGFRRAEVDALIAVH